ncbi:MAG: formate dehydrogenase subunit delta [Gammaproteobacteria bacterium]|jgi:formate dehydrogenase subunit delta|uniref:formate dehydrogenase subunit delta n=1 Tax=Nevskia sp. TaxID=1929292 RepID=UPI0040374B1C|nr:formate dehydrogenase subunit delta [Gammaproteobacteria bacterium]
MNPQNLSEMANNIADFFAAEPDHAEAVAGVANHIDKFWEPRMQKQLRASMARGEATLNPLVIEALAKLAPA